MASMLYFLNKIFKDRDLTSESESEELELEELDESLELSEAMPVDSCKSTESANAASSGCSCFRILEGEENQVDTVSI